MQNTAECTLETKDSKEEIAKKEKIIRFACMLMYLLPFFIWDDYNIIPLLGAYCLYRLLVSFNATASIGARAKASRKEKIYVLSIMGLEIFFSYIFRFFFSEYYDIGSISFGEFNLIPTFIFWIELASVLVYYCVIRRENVFLIKKRAIIFSVLVILPFIYSTVLSMLPFAVKGTEIIDMSPISCLNASYRAFILAGFIEELFYRGLVYDGMKTMMSKSAAIIWQGAFFSLIHSRQMVALVQTGDINIAINFLCVFGLGVISAKIKDYTKSFLPSMLLHGCLNGGIYYLGLFLVQ